MRPLEKSLRNKLEKTIKDARDIAEDAARAALEQVGVGEPTAYPHLTEADRKLRRKLRAHGRQLGNGRDAKGRQELDRLIEEVAYEHWHRMLFARFLAENNLLMFSENSVQSSDASTQTENCTLETDNSFADFVAITLEEAEDVAQEYGFKNGWELSAKVAARMLPQIFRPDSSVFQFSLPPEHQQKLERLIADLPQEVFSASDSLGWVYQFWQAKRKDEVNASEVKIGARELPAVTQLFTESYMVSFLLDNSLGAWWASRRLSEVDLKGASSEDELRSNAAIPGVPLQYLRFVQQETGTWTTAAGTFDSWPDNLGKLKTLDPCCGSGHFLVAAFIMLVPMRMKLEGLTAKEAVAAVLRENIHGLELDQRCVELAAFALALTAWKYPDAGGYRPLPELNVACSGLSVSEAKEEWKQLAFGKQNLRIALDWMHDTFKDAPVLGSLLNPAKTEAAKIVQWEELSLALEQALKQEQPDEQQQEAAVVAQGLSKASMLLAGQYQWVITNVPYLVRGKQNDRLRDFCEKHYPAAKNDLATVFLDRCLDLCIEGGTSSIVLPQNWLFLASYRKFREKLLRNETWHLIARLGPGAFETISGEVVKAILINLSRGNAAGSRDELFGKQEPAGILRGVDVSEPRTASEKAAALVSSGIKSIDQAKQLENPGSTVLLDDFPDLPKLGDLAGCYLGICTGDYQRFGRKFLELPVIANGWNLQRVTVDRSMHWGGMENALLWEDGSGSLFDFVEERLGVGASGTWLRGKMAWRKMGVTIKQMGDLPVTIYSGELYNNNVAVLIPKDINHLLPIWLFCSSPSFNENVRIINQTLAVDTQYILSVPFNLDHWTKVAKEKYPNGLPKPYSDDPTQWIFHGHPTKSNEPLQVAVARLLGYRWPAETNPDMELSDESIACVKKSQELLSLADEDGIVCIPAVRGEMKAEDRLENLLATSYGSEWSSNKKAELLAQIGHAGKTLETWLRDKFFIQHCKLFNHRPFIWHIWDGLHDGFAALVNYHKLDAKLMETLIYTYLGDWITRQKQDIGNGVDGAQEKLAAAEALKKKLELILEGEAPHDIFIRWKPIEKQPIGWNPDLNDGGRLNIRPFMTVGDVKKRGAGVLRDKPNIKWTKDRGKDVASAPWYHLGPQYGGNEGDRINDHHLTLEEKQKARGQIK